MTFVGVFGIFLGLLASLWAFVHPNRTRIAVFVTAYVMHLGATAIYYQLVQAGGADAALYYYDPMGYFEQGFGLNTFFIVYITQALKSVFGGTYFDYFLLFQSFGFIGIAFLMRSFEEVYVSLGVKQPAYAYLILFLPSVHYWTAALGKDGLFFLATTMAVWSMMAMRQRMLALGFAVVLLFLIRPHIAMLTMAGIAVTVVKDRGVHPAVRAMLVAVAGAGFVYAIVALRSSFQIDLANANVVSDMLAGREALLQTEAAGRTAVTGSYPVRVFSLLFRPLFFDAGGALGLIVSFENAILMTMIGTMLFHFRTMRGLFKSVPYVRFALTSSVLILLLLSIGYYNVGLGIRQKAVMILPGLLIVFVTLRAVLQARKAQAAPPEPGVARAAIA